MFLPQPRRRRCARVKTLRFRPQVEELEDRRLLSVLSFTAPTGNGADNMVLRLNGKKVEILDSQVHNPYGSFILIYGHLLTHKTTFQFLK